ncbi:MAG: LysM peptidoglycan-binding domain-containing protein [Bacilli bacterium]|nr:LysM peptidoglycan-binding domain-containing protein [Bacilli bacterium]
MNEIIPLKKDIIFKTRIGEITSISLEHDYKINNDIVEGFVEVSGSYKMTEASVNYEEFLYTIPFSIALSKKIKEESLKIEIDDFKYKFNKDVLSVNIELLLSCEEMKEEVFNMEEFFEKKDDVVNDIEFIDIDNNIEIKDNEIEIENKDIEIKDNDIEINNITNNIINEDKKYYKYKVYIVRQNDTIDSICNKYNVNINDIKEYNDISNINIGDKLVIPYVNE